MKICFCVSRLLERSQTFVTTQILHAVRAGHDVTVACREVAPSNLNAADQADIDKVRIMHWPPAPPPLVQHLPASVADKITAQINRRTWRREIEADVVIAHFGNQGALIARAQSGWADRPPLITIYHGRDVSVEYARDRMARYRQLLAEGDLHLPVNRSFAELLVKAGAPADRVETLHLGVPVERYPFTPKPVRQPLHLTSVCRLVQKKGLDVAIEALALLHAQHPEIDWRYDIGGDGPLAGALRSQVARHGLTDRIRFLGALSHDETLQQIAAADALLAPSVTAEDGDQEGIPVTLMEAMALGTVVVTSRHSGIPELVEDGVSGYLADERDVEGVKNILATLGRSHVPGMAQRARACVERSFDDRSQSDALLRFASEMVREPARLRQASSCG
ncbi:MAG: glycosyltransferase [Pseudomonadota bacterium]